MESVCDKEKKKNMEFEEWAKEADKSARDERGGQVYRNRKEKIGIKRIRMKKANDDEKRLTTADDSLQIGNPIILVAGVYATARISFFLLKGYLFSYPGQQQRIILTDYHTHKS